MPQIPIARPTGRSPDLISKCKATNDFYFNEAKARRSDSTVDIWEEIEKGVFNNLLSNTCNVYRLILTKVHKISPIEVSVIIYEAKTPSEKKGSVLNHQIILEALRPQIRTKFGFKKKILNGDDRAFKERSFKDFRRASV